MSSDRPFAVLAEQAASRPGEDCNSITFDIRLHNEIRPAPVHRTRFVHFTLSSSACARFTFLVFAPTYSPGQERPESSASGSSRGRTRRSAARQRACSENVRQKESCGHEPAFRTRDRVLSRVAGDRSAASAFVELISAPDRRRRNNRAGAGQVCRSALGSDRGHRGARNHRPRSRSSACEGGDMLAVSRSIARRWDPILRHCSIRKNAAAQNGEGIVR